MQDPRGPVNHAIADAAATLGVLADIDRFKVISAIALGAGDISAIAESSGIPMRSVEKALSRLVAADLITNDIGRWRVRFDELQLQAREAAAERAAADTGPEGAADVVRRFFKHGRLTFIPASHSKRVAVLDHLVQVFEPGRVYPEGELNERLSAFHEDYASLRRYMVEEGLLDRADNKYWRTGGTFEVD
ncbi:MAG: DUF2087 domain-containing protein [Actinomycetota bacterium]